MKAHQRAVSVLILILAPALMWAVLSFYIGQRSYAGAFSANNPPVLPAASSDTPEQSFLLKEGGQCSLPFAVDKDGVYEIVLTYRITTQNIVKPNLNVKIDGALPSPEWGNIQLQPLWFDKGGTMFDRNNNEIQPQQTSYDGWQSMSLYNTGLYSYTPLSADLAAGDHTITFENLGSDVEVGEVLAVPAEEIPVYEEYRLTVPQGAAIDISADKEADSGEKAGSGQDSEAVGNKADLIIIEAEDYAFKTDSTVRARNIQNTGVLPFDPDNKLLNVIDEDSFAQSGQSITWQVDIPEDGFYHIGLKYRTMSKQNAITYRTLLIDHKIPFTELENIGLPFTGEDWANILLTESSGSSKDQSRSMPVYLTKGKHDLTLLVNAEPISEIGIAVEEIMTKLNDFSAALVKITGNRNDALRTWDIDKYMPGAVTQLQGYADRLEELYAGLRNQQGGRMPTYAEGLKIAVAKIKDVLKEPNRIPSRINTLTEGDTSAARHLGNVLELLYLQPLSIDRIYVLKDNEGKTGSMPSPKAPPLSNFFYGSRAFLRSFFVPPAKSDPDALKIWANLPLPYVELLQQMADTRFTPEFNIKADISTMPNDEKLILSNAAGEAPDIALGLPSGRPFNYGIRGAVKDLAQFPDFWDYVNEHFSPETIVPYRMNDKVYGITEAQDFYVLFYRTDILEALGLTPPDTWEDVQRMMPVLTRNSKTFYIPAAGWSGYKPFYTTTPFIYQAGGQVYRDDASAVAFSNEKTLKGLTVLTDLFRIYSLPAEVPNFYNDFRYGKVPIGVSNFSTYVWLMSAAPELAGKWAIAPSPGMLNENGEVVRYQIAADRAAIILEQSDKPDEAWDFIKWWLSTDTQLAFGTSLQINLGSAYMWNTANLEAFAQLPFRQSDKNVILEQWKWIKELPPHPAAYMAERALSDLWNDVVIEGMSVRLAADRNSVDVNREILLKLEEFGFYKDGRMVEPYNIREWGDANEQTAE